MRPVSPQLAAAFALLAPVAAQSPPPGFVYRSLSDGVLDRASCMAFLPDGRLLVGERCTGRIRVYADDAVAPAAWATVPTVNAPSTEQGLLGIAVDPGFLTNAFVYVYFTDASGAENRIARLQEVRGLGRKLQVLTPPGLIPAWGIHNGGRLCFGSDGCLYAGVGDVATPQQAPNPAFNTGKVLRFTAPQLTVPADNPIASSFVWSSGHRNLFGLAADPVSGALFATENGFTTADELNRIVRGGDFGWPVHEGPETTPDPTTVDPIATWSPPIAPVGCCFYTGANYPAGYVNELFVAEYVANRLRRLTLDAARAAVTADAIFDDHPVGTALDVADGPDGNLWFLHADSHLPRGADELSRYEHQNAPVPGVNIGSVTRRILGGSLTIGYTGGANDLFLGWVSAQRLATPLTTVAGQLWVSPDFVLPFARIGNGGRGYLAWPVANDPAYVGVTVHVQALQVPAAPGPLVLTNAHALRL